jgi:hypothetical protein
MSVLNLLLLSLFILLVTLLLLRSLLFSLFILPMTLLLLSLLLHLQSIANSDVAADALTETSDS